MKQTNKVIHIIELENEELAQLRFILSDWLRTRSGIDAYPETAGLAKSLLPQKGCGNDR